MGIKRVLRKSVETIEVWDGATCDCCGKALETNHWAKDHRNFVEGAWNILRVTGEYGNDFPPDGDTVEIVVCDACLEAWVGTFKTPPAVTGMMFGGYGPQEATHSETGEVMLYWRNNPGGWIWPKDSDEPEHDDQTDEGWPTEVDPRQRALHAGDVWQHFKGQDYVIKAVGYDSRDHGMLVVYQALYGDSKVWCRPADMWFEEVARGEPRFRNIG